MSAYQLPLVSMLAADWTMLPGILPPEGATRSAAAVES